MRNERLAALGIAAELAAFGVSAEPAAASDHQPATAPEAKSAKPFDIRRERFGVNPAVDAGQPLTIEKPDNVVFTGEKLTPQERELFYWAYSLATDYANQFEQPGICQDTFGVEYVDHFDGHDTVPMPAGAINVDQCMEWINNNPKYSDNPWNLAADVTRLEMLGRGYDYTTNKRSIMSGTPTGRGTAPPKEATLKSFQEFFQERLAQLQTSKYNQPKTHRPTAGI